MRVIYTVYYLFIYFVYIAEMFIVAVYLLFWIIIIFKIAKTKGLVPMTDATFQQTTE